jgi:eukaryotic-like serine/threonine-protein kinase
MTELFDAGLHPSGAPPPRKDPSEELSQQWQQGQRPDVHAFVVHAGPLTPAQLLAVLRVDQRERWQTGELIGAEAYLHSYPVLQGDAEQSLELVYAEFLLRERRGETPTLAEFVARFPGHAHRLQIQIGLHQALQAVSLTDPDGAALPHPNGSVTLSGPSAATPSGASRWPVVAGYEILGELGRGGMGVVYQARHLALKRVVALKMILAGPHADSGQLARFRHEAEAVAQLQHPNIVQIHEVGEQDGRPFFSLEFVAGGSLEQKLAATPQPARPAALLVELLARATHYAHQHGIIHRDLKPANVLLQEEEQGDAQEESNGAAGASFLLPPAAWIPKLTDFGLAKYVDSDGGQTRSGTIVGTPGYMAPEQALGKLDAVGPAADIYALGAVLYEMLTGRPPFKAETPLDTLQQVLLTEPVPPSRLRPNVPRDLQTICLKCLEKAPARRYSSAEALAEDLGRFLAGQPIRARLVTRGERLWRRCRRNPGVAGLTSLAALLLVVIAVLSLLAALQLGVEAGKARDAERDATDKLWQARYAEARALRLGGRIGQRFESLKAIQEAAAITHTRASHDKDALALRNEAIACLALADLRVLAQWEVPTPWDFYVALDRKEERYAFTDEQGNIHVRRTADHQEIARLPGPGRPPLFVMPYFSLDGRYLLVCYHLEGESYPSVVWELFAQGGSREVVRIEDCYTCRFISDGGSLAVARRDGTLGSYDLVWGKARTLRRGCRAMQLAIRPDGKQLAYSDDHKSEVPILDAATGELLKRLPIPGENTALAWSSDNRFLAAASDNKSIYIWDATEGRQLAILEGHQARVVTLAFSPNGRLLASSSFDGITRLWDIESAKALVYGPGRPLNFSPDGRRLAFQDGLQMGIWEVADGPECRLLQPRTERTAAWLNYRGHECIDYSPDGRLVASVGGDGVRLWDVATAQETAHLAIGYHEATLFDPSSGRLLTYGRTGLKSWPIGSVAGKSATQIGAPQTLEVPRNTGWFHLSCSRDGGVLAVTNDRHAQIIVLKMAAPSERVVLPNCSDVVSLAVSCDGKWVAAGRVKGTVGISIWDAHNGCLVRRLPAGRLGATQLYVAFSPDGQWLVSGGLSDYRFWKVDSWEPGPVIAMDYTARRAGPLVFSRDGRMLAISRSTQQVQLIDLANHCEVATLSAPDARTISRLCFNPDGTKLAASTDNHVVQLWDLRAIRRQLQTMNLDWDSPP